MAKKGLTPMMQQYFEVREGLPDDALLLFRLGDFYEMFLEDAQEGSRILGITLTNRHGMLMAGIPYHAADNYIGKVLAAGMKVAICDQVETPKAGKLVKRALTRILTPGTVLDANQLEASHNNFLLSLAIEKNQINAAWLDLSTSEFFIATDSNPENLLPVLASLEAREILISESLESSRLSTKKPSIQKINDLLSNKPVTDLADFHFDHNAGIESIQKALNVLNLDGFGIEKSHPSLGVAGALIQYVTETLCRTPENLKKIQEYKSSKALLMDPATLRNLEIFKTAGNARQGSLLDSIDETCTPAGARLLEQFLSAPCIDPEEIERRSTCVENFVKNPVITSDIRTSLKKVSDIQRILGRLENRICRPRELGGIKSSLEQFPTIVKILNEVPSLAIGKLGEEIGTFDSLRNLLDDSLEDELPANLQDGGIIKKEYDAELDRLRSLTTDNKSWLAALEAGEQEKTGIKNLKVKYNGAFGYFIEVTKANIALVPDNYIRKQTMTNAERYYTEELKQKEKEILNAEEHALSREEEIFRSLIDEVLKESDLIRNSAELISQLDIFSGWAYLANEWNYCKPELAEKDILEISEGRHPVVEQFIKEDNVSGIHAFVPNDCNLSSFEEQIALITGPNMAGKSTYIRQVALITLMAQIGCWVPATSCRLGIVDRIFSRVGASDELAKGNSTFMVEMNETANILNNHTEKSLIILDEIGRGTSTYDGLSIAWSVIEHLHGKGDKGARTLFATHYHELTQLESSLERIRNYSVAVKEWNDEIIFVRQVIPGAADRSYGIQVARLAGIPEPVIDRAKQILDKLENNDTDHKVNEPKPKRKAKTKPVEVGQLELTL